MKFSPAYLIDKTVSVVNRDRFIFVPYILFFVGLYLVRVSFGKWIPKEGDLTIAALLFVGGSLDHGFDF